VAKLTRPGLEDLGRVLEEGARQGVFPPGLDVRHVYLALAALGYFYLSNRYTLSSFLDIDLMQRKSCDDWLEEMTRVMLASVCLPAAPSGPTPAARPRARQNARPSPARRPPRKT
jgi:TetR/AcrR family transcriptional regulator